MRGWDENKNQFDSEKDGIFHCPMGFVVRRREYVERVEKCTHPDCGDCPIRERNLI